MSLKLCMFSDCQRVCDVGLDKCLYHRHRKLCNHPSSCSNQVYARGLCVKHGGKQKCKVPDCDKNTRAGHLCSSHYRLQQQMTTYKRSNQNQTLISMQQVSAVEPLTFIKDVGCSNMNVMPFEHLDEDFINELFASVEDIFVNDISFVDIIEYTNLF